MSEILSQDEVDSLLNGLSSGDVDAETDSPPEPGEILPYDFSSQDRVIRGRMPTFQVINDRLAREMSNSLSNLLKTKVDVNSNAIETQKFSEFCRSLPVPTSLHVYRMQPFRGSALLVLESALVFNLIDSFFGGSGNGESKVEGREFTVIEGRMINKVVVACLADLEQAWIPVEPIKAEFVRAEVNPQFATIVPPEDLVIVSRFELDWDPYAGTITFCIPYAMIEPIRNKLVAGFQSDRLEVDVTWQKRLKEIILESVVDFSVHLGSAEITGEKLIYFKPGDVIQLDQDADQCMPGFVEGILKFNGFAGVQRKHQAYKIGTRVEMEGL
jgi:flagellar motor switch protein FliM